MGIKTNQSQKMKIDQLILPFAILVAAIILKRNPTKLQGGGGGGS